MKFLTPTLVLLSALGVTNACLTFDGTINNQPPRKIVGKLVDNGIEVCKVDKTVDTVPVQSWVRMDCVMGVTAYVQNDGSKIGYSHGAQVYEFGLNQGKTLKGNDGQKRELWAKNYGC